MKQTVTFRRSVTVTLEFEVEQPLLRRDSEGWAKFGWCGKSAVDQAIAQNTNDVDLSEGAWEVVSAEPDFRAEETGDAE